MIVKSAQLAGRNAQLYASFRYGTNREAVGGGAWGHNVGRHSGPLEAPMLRPLISAGAIVLLLWTSAMIADTPLPRPVPGRSLVATRLGIVAASQPLAARAGVQVLERGGSAVDAAIAANAVMGLMEPTGNGIGGDLFALIYDAKTGMLHGLNASGWAPRSLTAEYLKGKGVEIVRREGGMRRAEKRFASNRKL